MSRLSLLSHFTDKQNKKDRKFIITTWHWFKSNSVVQTRAGHCLDFFLSVVPLSLQALFRASTWVFVPSCPSKISISIHNGFFCPQTLQISRTRTNPYNSPVTSQRDRFLKMCVQTHFLEYGGGNYSIYCPLTIWQLSIFIQYGTIK